MKKLHIKLFKQKNYKTLYRIKFKEDYKKDNHIKHYKEDIILKLLVWP